MSDITEKAPKIKQSIFQYIWKTYFSTLHNTAITVTILAILAFILPPFIQWALVDAVFTGTGPESCLDISGACWYAIVVRFKLFVYGLYPESELWRVNAVFALSAFTLVVLVWQKINMKMKAIYIMGILPVSILVLLYGGVLGLPSVASNNFGGLLVTVFLGIIGSIASIPVGILLALGRRSRLPAFNVSCTFFIEIARAMPMITWLFMASLVLQMFLPAEFETDKMLRVLFLLILVSAASKAEIIRAGFQAIPKGQFEACNTLGIGYWSSTFMIILPQVMRTTIPALLLAVIGMFKDASLVAIIGLMDFLSVGMRTMDSSDWGKYGIEIYFFVALVYFLIIFSMSKCSMIIEDQLNTDKV